MTKVISIKISGIKCDDEGCDYKDDTVSRDNYPAYVNKPCPKCGSNLLTQEDYESVIMLEGVADLDINLPMELLQGEEEIFDASMDGSGIIDIVKREKE